MEHIIHQKLYREIFELEKYSLQNIPGKDWIYKRCAKRGGEFVQDAWQKNILYYSEVCDYKVVPSAQQALIP